MRKWVIKRWFILKHIIDKFLTWCAGDWKRTEFITWTPAKGKGSNAMPKLASSAPQLYEFDLTTIKFFYLYRKRLLVQKSKKKVYP